MRGFFEYETADLQLIIEDNAGNPKPGVLDDVSDIVVSIAQGNRAEHWHLDDDNMDIDAQNSTINLHLVQSKAGKFSSSMPAEVQVNILYENAERDVTLIETVDVFRNLYKQEMK